MRKRRRTKVGKRKQPAMQCVLGNAAVLMLRTGLDISSSPMVRFLLRSFILLIVLALAGFAYAVWPRQADLRRFDADAVARLETSMWRNYYDHDDKSLVRNLYSLYRDVYHFSPADSAQLAYNAGTAAQLFQPTKSREEAQVALPLLQRYYALLRSHGGEKFDPEKAATLELNWWQLRRENATPEEYGKVIGQVAGEIFGVHNEHIDRSSLLRAQMMQYRDERRTGLMQPEDWAHIEQQLAESYRELKTGVAPGMK